MISPASEDFSLLLGNASNQSTNNSALPNTPNSQFILNDLSYLNEINTDGLNNNFQGNSLQYMNGHKIGATYMSNLHTQNTFQSQQIQYQVQAQYKPVNDEIISPSSNSSSSSLSSSCSNGPSVNFVNSSLTTYSNANNECSNSKQPNQGSITFIYILNLFYCQQTFSVFRGFLNFLNLEYLYLLQIANE